VAKKDNTSDKQVTRISASDTSTPKKAAKTTSAKKLKAATKTAKQPSTEPKEKGIFGSIIGYFTGAWYELRQVRWPNRRATWGLTGAVIIFTAFFVLFIVLLDLLFSYLFELILK
jgi:preprotein translocase subunit SecE